ncbi:muts domain V-domain-containing protein [Infundibulicybe gibba]|nr:muts domain V-domain-containing protein [Infundibulicybe gibba]
MPIKSQATISAFFAPPTQIPTQNSGPSTTRQRSASFFDLTNDSDEDAPVRKRQKTAPAADSATATSPRRVSGSVEQWRFTPGRPGHEGREDGDMKGDSNSEEQKARKRRHEAFKNKLLQENNRFLPHKPKPDAPDEEEERQEDDSSDGAFEELRAAFSNKHKSRTVAVRATKKAEQVQLGPSGQAYTPLELQVLRLKRENPGTVLMVEVGYRYKFFDEDAETAAKELGMIAFSDRNFTVASIPTHRRDVHLKKLLSQGYKVGIINQIETAALKKASETRNAPFERKLVHLYTAATYVDGLDSVDSAEQYTSPPFMCIIEEKKAESTANVSFGIITICPSTGDVTWDDFDDMQMRIELETRLVHTRPTELLLPRDTLTEPTIKMLRYFTGVSAAGDKIRTEYFEDVMSYTDAFSLVSEFYTQKRSASISENFKTGKLMAVATDFPKRVIVALAHLIKHLSAFSIADALLETRFFNKFTTMAHMLLASNTLTNLEIYRNETDHTARGSLIWILDQTKTKFGARLLRTWVGRPLVDKHALQDRTDAVEEILSSSSELLVTLRQLLRKLPDLAKGLCRIQYGQCTPQELAVLLPAFNKLALAFEPVDEPSRVGFQSRLLNEIIFSFPKLREPMKETLAIISLKKAAEGRKDIMWTDPERYPAIADADLGIQSIEVELEDELKSVRKILRMPALKWTAVGGDEYLVEVRRNDNRSIPASWHSISRTKYYERFQPPKVKRKLEERSQYQETLQAEANKGFSHFLQEISENHYGAMRDAVNKLATADCLLSLALVALREGYVRPQITDDDSLEIIDGRHPMVEVLRSDPFVANTVQMGGDAPRNKIITGPNMGGKSSAVRMIALIAIMAQIGSYVPAKSVKLGLLDSVHTRMGASDDLARGRSTFMVEMSETSDILRSATRNSLVVLDELGRGTSTFDGMAIAEAVMHQLTHETKCKTLFITHYPSVASNLERIFPAEIENLHMGYEEDTRIDGVREITFLFKLARGIAPESFGIECGRLAVSQKICSPSLRDLLRVCALK